MSTLEISLMLLTLLAMEGTAWLAHRYLMHGFLWFLHEDHHIKTLVRLKRTIHSF